jgi:signal transduction histidine kinase
MRDSMKVWKILATVGIYLLVIAIVFGLEVRDPKVLLAFFGIAFLISALAWEVLGNVVLAGATALMILPFLPAEDSSFVPASVFGASAALVGGGIGVFNRSERKQKPRSDVQKYYPQDIFQRAQNPMVIIDPSGRVLERNDRAVEMLGSVKHFSEIIHFEDLDRARSELERALRMGEAIGTDLRAVTWDKDAFQAEIKMRHIDDDQIWIELNDLSGQKVLEKKLWETEARYRYLIEDAIDTLDTGIVLLNQDHRVIWANETLGTLFKLDRDEMIGAEMDKVLSKVRPCVVEESAISEILGAGEHNFVFTLNDGFDERILEFRSIPIETERYRGGRIDHYIDLTELKTLERKLVEKTDRLVESNTKLEEFSHVVSHDLKQPLRTIQAFTQFIIDDYSDKLDEQGIDYLKSLQRSSFRMKNLIDDLLNLSSIGTKKQPMENLEVTEILSEVREDLSAILENVHVQVPESLPIVMANRTRTLELFANLISNGVKYNDKEDKEINVEYEEFPDEYLFRVRDNGVGIDQRYQGKIFELFERLNPVDDPDSTGAGLAITKRIVNEMGGRIWVESEVGEGSTFSFSVPKRSRVETRVHQHT